MKELYYHINNIKYYLGNIYFTNKYKKHINNIFTILKSHQYEILKKNNNNGIKIKTVYEHCDNKFNEQNNDVFINIGLLCSLIPNDFSLSLIMNHYNFYYNTAKNNEFVSILKNKNFIVSEEDLKLSNQAIKLMINYNISQYNFKPNMPHDFFTHLHGYKILIIDHFDLNNNQNCNKTINMINDAIDSKPFSNYIVKIHDKNINNKNYINEIKKKFSQVIILTEQYQNLSIIKQIDEVYVFDSLEGFESCLLSKKVKCFGQPFYAGWGFTNDTMCISTIKRSVQEIFSVLYLKLSLYYDPILKKKSNIIKTIKLLSQQRQFYLKTKNKNIATLCLSNRKRKRIPFFIKSIHKCDQYKFLCLVSKNKLKQYDELIFWGKPSNKLNFIFNQHKLNITIVEDGFIRSCGLGVNYAIPLSLVFDNIGIYYDPNRTSKHEQLCLNTNLNVKERKRTINLIKLINYYQITKYNCEPIEKITFNTNKKIILVVGQVSDDQSVQLGSPKIKTNLHLIKIVRENNPHDYIVYKPHPDVLAKRREGHINATEVYVNKIVVDISIVSCIQASDEIHTMTSLSGFDAIIRGKKVFTYGMPFYAGWGLTIDYLHCTRRYKTISLETLVYVTLIKYPQYFDIESKNIINVEQAIQKIIQLRKNLN